MYLQGILQLILALVLCPGSKSELSDSPNAGHYSQTLIDSIMDIYSGSSSSSRDNDSAAEAPYPKYSPKTSYIVPAHLYPYLLLALWVTCICCIICCCLYCKCQQAEMMTAYNSNSFELQEVHVLDHPLPHVKGCVCLGCLQRQVAQELQLKRQQ